MIQQAMANEAAGNTGLDFSLFASATWAANRARHLARYKFAGNNKQHRLILQAVKPSPWDAGQMRAEVLAATVVDCSGGTEGQYFYSALQHPAFLKPNTEYIVASYEEAGTASDNAYVAVQASLGTEFGDENSNLFKQNGGILGNVVSNNAGLLWSNVESNNSGIVSLKCK